MKNLSSPLGLRNRIKTTTINIECIPFINIVCIAFFISLLSSKYLFAPGLNITLPESHETVLQGATTHAILTISETNIIFFEGNIYNLDNIQEKLTHFINSNGNKHPTLLIKMDKNTDINMLFQICELAQKANFSSIQLAANPHNIHLSNL